MLNRNKTFQFISLAHLLNVAFLKDCYNHLARNKAIGIDGISWQEYRVDLDSNIKSLVEKLKQKVFQSTSLQEEYIFQKGMVKLRPLGISAIENKIVESGIKRILESIYESDFLNCSYGFRPKRNTHQALNDIDTIIMTQQVNHIVEADIKGFFDNVNHDMLLEFIKHKSKRYFFTALNRKVSKSRIR